MKKLLSPFDRGGSDGCSNRKRLPPREPKTPAVESDDLEHTLRASLDGSAEAPVQVDDDLEPLPQTDEADDVTAKARRQFEAVFGTIVILDQAEVGDEAETPHNIKVAICNSLAEAIRIGETANQSAEGVVANVSKVLALADEVFNKIGHLFCVSGLSVRAGREMDFTFTGLFGSSDLLALEKEHTIGELVVNKLRGILCYFQDLRVPLRDTNDAVNGILLPHVADLELIRNSLRDLQTGGTGIQPKPEPKPIPEIAPEEKVVADLKNLAQSLMMNLPLSKDKLGRMVEKIDAVLEEIRAVLCSCDELHAVLTAPITLHPLAKLSLDEGEAVQKRMSDAIGIATSILARLSAKNKTETDYMLLAMATHQLQCLRGFMVEIATT